MNTTDLVVTNDLQTAGSVVYWELRGELDLGKLAVAWSEADLDPTLLPERPSAKASLARAMRELSRPRRLARRISAERWALVDEAIVDGQPVYAVHLSARLLDGGSLVVESTANAWATSEVETAYWRARRTVTTGDVGTWLVGLARRHSAVALRETGGFYFLPRAASDAFAAYGRALERASESRVRRIPAMRAEAAVEAVISALRAEADKEASELAADLASGELGARALQTRVEHAEAVRDKVNAYGALLETDVRSMTERLDELRAALAAARLTVLAEQLEAASAA